MADGTSLLDHTSNAPVEDGEELAEDEASPTEEEGTQVEDSEDDEESVDSDEASEEVQKLKQRVKDNQKAYREATQDIAVLKAQLQAYREQAQTAQAQAPSDDQWKQTLASIEEAEEPAVRAYELAMETSQTLYDEVLRLRQELKQEISKSTSMLSPERLALQDVIDDLEGEEWFAVLPPDKQLQAARKLKGNGASRKTPPGGELSGRKPVKKKKKEENKSLLPDGYRKSQGLGEYAKLKAERKNTLLG